jgi:hypothetical protein
MKEEEKMTSKEACKELAKSITAEDVCRLLNEFLDADPKCANALLSHRIKCNKKIANHRTIQVQQFGRQRYPRVGIIGLLNGMFGIRKDGRGALCADIGKNGKFIYFKPTPIVCTVTVKIPIPVQASKKKK